MYAIVVLTVCFVLYNNRKSSNDEAFLKGCGADCMP